jgi:S-DNA-T family DNA segregation ATPase FtsK/SpoIIIE
MATKKTSKRTAEKNKPKQDTSSLKGLILLSISSAIFLSLISFAITKESHNWLGLIGQGIGKFLHAVFGVGSYIFASYLFWLGWRQLFNKPINHPRIKVVYLVVFTTSLCILLSLMEDLYPSFSRNMSDALYPNHRKAHYHLGGALFYFLYRDLPGLNFLKIFNSLGVALVFTTTLLTSFFFLTKTNPAHLLKALFGFLKKIWNEISPPHTETVEESHSDEQEDPENQTRFVKLRTPESTSNNTNQNNSKDSGTSPQQELLEIQPDVNPTVRPSLSQKLQFDRKKDPIQELIEKPIKQKETSKEIAAAPKNKRQAALSAQKVHNGDFKEYKLPPTSLLTTAKKVDQSSLKQDLRRQAEVLEETLQSFGIEAKVGQINCGPTITSFEVHPAIGVKVQKIRTLENDIALNMEAKSIRIIAPIPGKAAVGIEVPNPQPQEVGFKDMLNAYQQGSKKFHIPILLGKAVNGDYVMADLTKMPHCIIAGATGSGKSVCINTIVMSVLLNAKPDEVKMIMVDPKKVELTPYTKLPHMLAPVITEPQGACAALNWLVKEMESRYEILKQLGVRNIEAFNTRTINKELESALDREIPARLPYIMVIIDELADLMMVASNDIETPIARIAQMARAVGIHLILATQRPSREVITGLIKANFPTRISFKVASRVNSQIILDDCGAESLLGNGDMLFLPPGSSTLIRAQGAFIRDEDITAVVNQICSQAPPNYVIASFDALGKQENDSANTPETNGDSLFEQAVEIVLNNDNASTTFLQRKLKIGYARAASLMDQMVSEGVIGPPEGSKPRKILKPKAQTAAVESQAPAAPKEINLFDEETI